MASPAAVLQVFVNANTKVASAQLQAFNAQLTGVGKTSAATGAGMGKFTKGAAAAGAGVAAFGAAAVVAGKQLYDLGVEFDDAYDKIRVGTGATGRELEKLKGNFREVAKTVPNDFEEVGTAIADLNTRLGLTGKPLERMAEQILHLSNITGEDLESNIKSVARSFVDWEVPVSKQTSALDGLFRLSQKSGSTVSEIADNIQKFGSPLRTLGKDIEYGAALFANFERAGVNMQTTLPGLKQFIGNLAKPTEDLSAQLKQLGINANDPAEAFERTLEVLGPGSKLTEGMKKNFAVAIFGKRAYADMLEAIKQGRFELDQFIDVFNNDQGDSIRKAASETYDFSENVRILSNNIKIFLEPAANSVFVTLDKMTRRLNEAVKAVDEGREDTDDLAMALKILAALLKAAGAAIRQLFIFLKLQFQSAIANVRDFARSWQFVRSTVSDNVKRVIDSVKRLLGAIKSTLSAMASVMRDRFKKSWAVVTGIARNGARAIVDAVKGITRPVRSVFQGIAEIVKDKFRSAYQSAVSFINRIISVLNSIPFLPDIGLIGGNNFGEGSSRRGAPPGRPGGMQRGGALRGGSPTGDSIPAMLERGEYVLNREAVKKIGVERLNKINFSQAPRFQTGGYIDTLTEFPAKFFKPIKDAGTSALELLMNGPGQFLKLLPKPNISQPFTAVGPYLLDAAKAFIKRVATSPLKNNDWVDSNTFAVARFLASKFNASISSSYRSPAQNAAVGGVPNSSHTRGTPSNPGAFDFVPPSGGMQSFAGKNIAGIVENMIHDVGSGLHNHIAFFQKGGFVGNINRRYPEANSAYGNWGGPTLPSYVVAALAQAAGMPGRTMEQVTRGESGAHKKHSARPGATGIDPGGTKGHGLWMITSGYNEDLAAKVGGWGQMLNPVINAWAAAQIYRRQGLRAWYGTGSVTGDGVNYTGKYDIRKALGGYGYQGALYRATGGKLGSKPKGRVGAAADKADKAKNAAKKKAKAKRIQKKIARIAARGLNFPGSNKIASLEAAADKAIETIDLFDREATAEWSPAGSDYNQGELSSLISYYQGLLDNYLEQRRLVVAAVEILRARIAFWRAKIQATQNPGGVVVANGQIITPGKKWQVRGWRRAISNARSTIGTLGEKRVNLEGLTGQGGLIADTQFRLRELGATNTTPPDQAAANDSEIADLLREQLRETQRALAISQAQMPIFQQFMPRFHQGGIVQGPTGAERPVMAQAGEGIFTREQMRAMGGGNITVVIEDAAIDSNRIRVEVDGVIQEKVSTVRRQGSNRRFATK